MTSLFAIKRLHKRTFAEYFRCCRLLVDELGRNRPVTDLRPDDFERLYEKLSSMYGLTTVGREISMVRSVFKYAVESDLIDCAVKFGPSFKAPSKREHRKRKGKIERRYGKMMFQAAEIRVTVTGTFYARHSLPSFLNPILSLRLVQMLGSCHAQRSVDLVEK